MVQGAPPRVGARFVVVHLSTPRKLDCLVFGYLWLEKVISGLGDIKRLAVSEVVATQPRTRGQNAS